MLFIYIFNSMILIGAILVLTEDPGPIFRWLFKWVLCPLALLVWVALILGGIV